MEVQATLQKRYKEKQQIRESDNAETGSRSTGTQVQVGDMVLDKEKDTVLAKGGVRKLSQDP